MSEQLLNASNVLIILTHFLILIRFILLQIRGILGACVTWAGWAGSWKRWTHNSYFIVKEPPELRGIRVSTSLFHWIWKYWILSFENNSWISRYQAPGEIHPSFKMEYEKPTIPKNSNSRHRNNPYSSGSSVQNKRGFHPKKQNQGKGQS